MVHIEGLSGLQELAALRYRRAAIPFVSCAPQHASYVDNVACIALGANQVQLQTDKFADSARASDLSVHLVTRASSKDEFLGLSFDGVWGASV